MNWTFKKTLTFLEINIEREKCVKIFMVIDINIIRENIVVAESKQKIKKFSGKLVWSRYMIIKVKIQVNNL